VNLFVLQVPGRLLGSGVLRAAIPISASVCFIVPAPDRAPGKFLCLSLSPIRAALLLMRRTFFPCPLVFIYPLPAASIPLSSQVKSCARVHSRLCPLTLPPPSLPDIFPGSFFIAMGCFCAAVMGELPVQCELRRERAVSPVCSLFESLFLFTLRL